MSTRLITLSLSAIALSLSAWSATLPPLPNPTPPMILERLGDYRREAATESVEARRWFDQGMALMLGYNFDGAIASFREATRIDPDFAMAWWGIGYAGGPNQNNPGIDKPKDEWSYAASRRAFELKDVSSWAVTGNRLVLTGKDGSFALRFDAK